MPAATGLDILASQDFATLRGRSIGVLCNQASIAADHRHILELLQDADIQPKAIFGPQHGLFGHTQDNMIEWEGQGQIYSLYGKTRKPTPEMLDGIDLFVVDLPDVGARYYTFIWTMSLCMEACAELGIPVMVLDRPNPIGGLQVEGTVLDSQFASFVGLRPLPTRHGMTIGEIAKLFRDSPSPAPGGRGPGGEGSIADCELDIVQMTGWSRSDYFDQTGLPWAMPSPNMPTLETAVVYPGACLLEGTNMSEGRGTTRPFETFGAPYLDGQRFARALNDLELPGCRFRAVQFQPTFQKHSGELCEGAFLHVIDRKAFEPVLAYVAILQEAIREADGKFEWKQPPYEYEVEKLPIDILAGKDWLRPAIENGTGLNEIRQRFLEECSEFSPLRGAALLYPTT